MCKLKSVRIKIYNLFNYNKYRGVTVKKIKKFLSLCFTALLLSTNLIYADIYTDNNIPTDQKIIIEEMVQKPSVFTNIKGLKRKSKKERTNDLIKWYKLNGKIDKDQDDFNSLGLDIKNFRNLEDFISYTTVSKEVSKIHHNKFQVHQFNYDNKFNFYNLVCSVDSKYTPKIFYILNNGKSIYSSNGKKQISDKKAIQNLDNGEYILKPVCGSRGQNIYFLKKQNTKIEVTDTKSNKIYLGNMLEEIKKRKTIIQEYIHQHEDLKKLNKDSLNTIRVVSLRYNDKANILAAMLRIGENNSKVDNAHKGGICVGVDIDTGKLKKYGCTYNKIYTKKNNISFEKIQIPFWKETIDLVKKIHNKVFYGASSLGFDIAITEKGPVIIEVNTGWGTKGLQACNGGLKKRYINLKKI